LKSRRDHRAAPSLTMFSSAYGPGALAHKALT
jgi:hypothetical protein